MDSEAEELVQVAEGWLLLLDERLAEGLEGNHERVVGALPIEREDLEQALVGFEVGIETGGAGVVQEALTGTEELTGGEIGSPRGTVQE